jgi:hypothetical protein
MKRPGVVLALAAAVAMLLPGCDAGADFQAAQTRVVRRQGMTDDRLVNATVAANAWQTIMRRRVTGPLDVELLVVAGGGGGGGSTAGGGGGGGVIYQSSFTLTPATTYTVTVGAGGLGSPKSNDGAASNTNGGNSVFGPFTAIGGGYGASGKPAGSRPASSGGSGGGAVITSAMI